MSFLIFLQLSEVFIEKGSVHNSCHMLAAHRKLVGWVGKYACRAGVFMEVLIGHTGREFD